MTDIQPYEPPTVTGHRSHLEVWADSARQAATIAVSLAKTPFVPASLRHSDAGVTAANITAAILTGAELNLEPMAALRSIDVIQGTPAMRAIALRALVQSRGHEVWVAEQTKTRAIVRGKRKGSDTVQESVWTMDRAKDLGLVSKDNWRKQPQAMLVARATTELCRLIAADVILGIPYSVEELEDGDQQETPMAAEVKPARRTAQRRLAPAPVETPEPAMEPEPVDEVEEILAELNAEAEPAEPTLDDA